jgi:hypothetical protein
MKDFFYKAAVFALLILAISLVLAFYINDYRTIYLADGINKMQNDLFDITTGFELMDDNLDCNIMLDFLNAYGDRVVVLGQYLSAGAKDKNSDKTYNELSYRYNYLNLLSWIKHKQIYSKCGMHKDIVLFAYGLDDIDSMYQGEVLDKMVSDYDIKVFAVAAYLSSLPMDMILRSVDNNGEYPILLINNKNYVGFKNEPELKSILEIKE